MSAAAEAPDARERILDAAEGAFSQGGFAAARVAAIADAAGVNKAMLYYYYGSKSELYQAVLERTFGQVDEMIQGALAAAGAPPAERAEGFLRAYAQMLHERPAFPRVLTREILAGGERLIPIASQRLSGPLAALVLALAEGRVRGTLNADLDPRFAPVVLIAPFLVFANARPLLEGLLGVDGDAAREAFERTALAILMDGLRARGGEGA